MRILFSYSEKNRNARQFSNSFAVNMDAAVEVLLTNSYDHVLSKRFIKKERIEKLRPDLRSTIVSGYFSGGGH